jgi:dephospho-CoA kinase
MAIVGLTGGIASGKSTVAARFQELGATIIDADQVARDVVEVGKPAFRSIRTTFGEGIIAEAGSIDRAALGKIVFADPTKLAILNAIIHPAIMAQVGTDLLRYRRQGLNWVIYEAALVIENGLSPGLTELVAVLCPRQEQLRRLLARNPISDEEARARIASQTDNVRRREAAQRVIENGGTVEELLVRADEVFQELVEAYGPVNPKSTT